MELKHFVEENKGMSSPKRDCRRLSIAARNQKATTRCNLLEAIAQAHGGGVVSRMDEDGVVRMKIVVKKQDLKHMLQMMENGNKNNSIHQKSPLVSSNLSLEQRLHVMRRRQLRRAENVKGGPRTWRPALQSIPEDL
ncbi:Protein of unknown function DUF4228 [Macleaya cordata]|uniref:Uncharacterized protein n=1 Tax=Macleaya cordata TaxID=56857 RepID=A0A200QEM6_MACCD|nr:Protein of unknown function DUF4228 [Macleaya cordata]